MSNSSASWFADDAALIDEVRRTLVEPRATPRVPGYEITSELHRGGQGVVYAALQRSTKRRVALKVLLDSAYYSASGRRRFEREIDLAASLDHPSIVRVYDSGATDEGRAYLAMQLVEGESLEVFAQRVGRDPERVLRALLAVCEAVGYAHQRGVIHRDLKPSNILIDSQDVPHVLDFGLAKFGGERENAESPSDSMALTTTGQFVGSLPWASPEQARGEQSGADTRSDVYSLGAVAYQMLTGKLPVDVTGPLHQALTNIATRTARPIREVRPELDEQVEIILATCLEKEPERRYQSVNALAQDIRDHLIGEPIQARRESAWRGLRRTVSRYRLAMIGGAIVLVVVAGMSVWALSSAAEAREQRSIAQGETTRADEAAKAATREAEEARRERARAIASLNFITRALSSADPDAPGGGKDVKVADVLIGAGPQVDSLFVDDPLTRADVHHSIGVTLSAIGMYDPAKQSLENSLKAWREAGLAESDARILRTRGNLLDVRLQAEGAANALEPLRDLAREQEAALGASHEDLASTLSDLGMAYKMQRRFAEAEQALRRALDIKRGKSLDEHTIRVRTNLAGVLADEEKYSDAITDYREIIADAEKSIGVDHAQTIMVRNNLATVLMGLGRLEEAGPVFEASLESCRRLRGEAHPITLLVMHNLGTLYHRLSRHEAARDMLSKCLEGRKKLLGAEHLDTIITMNNLALLLSDMGRFDEAIDIARESLAGRRKAFGEKHSNTIIGLNALAMTLLKAGRAEEALQYSQQAFDLSQPDAGVLPKGHSIEALMRGNLGRCYVSLARYDEAEAALLDSYAKLDALYGPGNDYSKRTAGYLADLYTKWDRANEAARFKDIAEKKKAP